MEKPKKYLIRHNMTADFYIHAPTKTWWDREHATEFTKDEAEDYIDKIQQRNSKVGANTRELYVLEPLKTCYRCGETERSHKKRCEEHNQIFSPYTKFMLDSYLCYDCRLELDDKYNDHDDDYHCIDEDNEIDYDDYYDEQCYNMKGGKSMKAKLFILPLLAMTLISCTPEHTRTDILGFDRVTLDYGLVGIVTHKEVDVIRFDNDAETIITFGYTKSPESEYTVSIENAWLGRQVTPFRDLSTRRYNNETNDVLLKLANRQIYHTVHEIGELYDVYYYNDLKTMVLIEFEQNDILISVDRVIWANRNL